MVWVIALLLTVIAVMAYVLWLSLNQTNDVLNFFTLTLLNDGSYRKHRDGLKFLVDETKAENAVELSMKVTYMLRKLIGDANSQMMKVSVVSLLWELKKNKGLTVTSDEPI